MTVIFYELILRSETQIQSSNQKQQLETIAPEKKV